MLYETVEQPEAFYPVIPVIESFTRDVSQPRNFTSQELLFLHLGSRVHKAEAALGNFEEVKLSYFDNGMYGL